MPETDPDHDLSHDVPAENASKPPNTTVHLGHHPDEPAKSTPPRSYSVDSG